MIDTKTYTDDWIETYSGGKFYIHNLEESDINIEDIAHSLSNLCRFNGHTKEFYSVAQHSVIVSYMCNLEEALEGLLHDATEAYLGDLSKPFKETTEYGKHYKVIEDRLALHIEKVFGINSCSQHSIKIADVKALLMEKRDLMGDVPWEWSVDWDIPSDIIIPLPPKESKELFLNRYKELKNE